MSTHAIVAVVVLGVVIIGAALFFWLRHLAVHALRVKNRVEHVKNSAQSEINKVQKAL